MEAQLGRANQNAAVIICSDGESSDGDIVKAIRPLENLPCNIVVRLCTDESRVIDYWNRVRRDLQADTINIIDDLRGEAAEINKSNPWLTYGEPIQRFREFGTNMPDFNALDEHMLTPRQLRLFVAHLLGGEAAEYPNPNEDLPGFQAEVARRLANEQLTWDPTREAMAKWINAPLIGDVYRGKEGCALM